MKTIDFVRFKFQNNQINFINRRIFFLCGFVILTLMILIIRISYLQIISSKKLVYEGNMRSLRIQRIPMIRGTISDRIGRPLAISIPAITIWANPKEIENYYNKSNINNNCWKLLADALCISLDKLFLRIKSNSKVQFIYLARQIDPVIGNYIYKLKLPGIYLCEESKRYYPTSHITANLIGITNIDHQGIEGIEKSFNNWLTGRSGKRIVRKDRFGRIIENISSVKGQAAHNLILSIDERIQKIVYHKLNYAVTLNKAESGIAILVDIDTGEILAMANSPSYNPNNLTNSTVNKMRNRAITDIFEPGSTVKPIVIMTALQYGIVQKNSVLNTTPYIINGHMIKDVTWYDKLNLTEILQKSSNVGVSKLALAMPTSALVNTYSLFGLGQKTNLRLIGENIGIYPHKKKWSNIEKATFSYGYGLMVTPLQLVRAYATIGSMGVMRPLSIMRVNSSVPGVRVFPESIVRTVIKMMENVALPGGSGVEAAIEGYRIAVKTGTTRKVDQQYGEYVNKYVAHTAGIVPASKPRFALVVIINEPKAGRYYGGAVSAPVFSAIMSDVLRIMNVKPDALSQNNEKISLISEVEE